MTMPRRVTLILRSLLALAVVAIGQVVLLAQGEKTFTPLSEQPQESISAPPLILGAYGFVWLAVFVYVFLLWQRLGKVERELADVNAQLAKRAKR